GKRVETVAATGRLRWTNCDPTRSYTIRRGTIARTPNGVAFATREDVFLPVAILDPPRIACQSRTVDVEAQREGPGGNVAAGSITVVPGNLNDVVIKVTNPAATSGGLREEFPQVTEEDVAAANAALAEQLDAQLAEVATAPDGVPEGATVYPETAERSEAIPSVPAEDLVGQEVETFELTLTAEGSVVAADPSPLEEIGLARIAAEVPEGMTLREGSEVVEIGEGAVEGQTVHYPVTARAEAYREISEDEVRVLVKGAEAPAAEAALAPYGTAEVVIWPDWAATVTTLDFRLDVTIVDLAPLTPAPATPSPEPGEALPAPTGELVPTPTTEALAPGSGGAGAVAP
ncbi:MAG: baseplate J/gp47 family protein, partial [Chloroflexi bacterium]|nr:baseplate J/gp47 family protein [Chloroflexota bacterium]